MLKTLSYIGGKLSSKGVAWGVGASLLLHRFGLVDKPNDIDILIELKDIEKADEILQSLGEKKPLKTTAAYSTKHFYEYTVGGFEVDVMAGFAVNHPGGAFEYVFDRRSVTELVPMSGTEIPFTALEDWFVLYQLMPAREPKAKMIEEYLLSNGVRHPFLLERALLGNLPPDVRERTIRMLDATIGIKKQGE